MFIIFPQAIAADCKRVTVLKYFLEALCGQEEPLLAFKGGKYISVATPSSNSMLDARRRQDSLTEKEVTVLDCLFNLLLKKKRQNCKYEKRAVKDFESYILSIYGLDFFYRLMMS